MTAISIALAALAVVCFCVMHIVARVVAYRKERNAKEEYEQLRKEFEYEIRNNGNIARIAQLRKRLLDLEAQRDRLNRG